MFVFNGKHRYSVFNLEITEMVIAFFTAIHLMISRM